jgi:hypothetical protein
MYETGMRLRVFENRVLRRIFGPKRDEVTGGRENHMRSLMNFTKCCVIKSRRMRWVGYVAGLGERSAYRAFHGKTRRDHLRSNPQDRSSRGNEPSGSLKCWEFLD